MDPGVPTARELGQCSLAAQHPSTRLWVDDAVRLDMLTEQCVDDVQLATDMDAAALRARRFAPGLPAEALLNRWLTASDDLNAMLSMRYEGGDPGRPFVDATVTSRPLTGDDLPVLVRAGAEIYGALRPRYLRLWSAAPPGRFVGTRPDRRFLAAPVGWLRAGFEQAVPTELRLTPARALDHYQDASAAYDDIDHEHPAHAEQAKVASYEALEKSLAAGTLFDVIAEGDWAGYVSVKTKGDSLGMPAYVVQELILARKFRGRGYGPHLTTLLARALPDGNRVLIGTIHADNRGARLAAERAGRVDVGGWIQVPLGTA
jgi:L-amino acid N-acyltransferase YncA